VGNTPLMLTLTTTLPPLFERCHLISMRFADVDDVGAIGLDLDAGGIDACLTRLLGHAGECRLVRRALPLEDCRCLLGRYARHLGGCEKEAVRRRGDLSIERRYTFAEDAVDFLVWNAQPLKAGSAGM